MTVIDELSTYLGTNYQSHKMVWDWSKEQEATGGNWLAYEQRNKESLYLYARRETHPDWWLPQLTFVREQLGVGDALDVRAATGWAGMPWAAAFADYQTKPAEFLRWRLKREKSKRQWYDLDKDTIPVYPLAVSLDGVNSAADPAAFIGQLAALGTVAVVGMDARLVDSAALMKQIGADYQSVAYRNVNHYVHLVAFATGAKLDQGE